MYRQCASFPVKAAGALTKRSTARTDERWHYMRIGSLHADYRFSGTAQHRPGGFKVTGSLKMHVWDTWQWTVGPAKSFTWHVIYDKPLSFWVDVQCGCSTPEPATDQRETTDRVAKE